MVKSNTNNSAALIIGLTIQGLAVARALSENGVHVFAVERHSNKPATKSRYLKLFKHDGVNPEALPATLIDLRKRIPYEKVVLFPCSDKSVRAVAANWEKLSKQYLLSWSDATKSVAELTNKVPVYLHAEKNGIKYPKTKVITCIEDCNDLDGLRFPLLVKPDQPPGTFKTRKILDFIMLKELFIEHSKSLPFIAQEWIDGDDNSLHFCTLFLDHGRILCSLTGRKQRSFPEGLGRGIVMELFEDAEIQHLSHNFFDEITLSGPVSIEFKRDSLGQDWLIEPNVGRTEYCVDLIIQGGLNLPYLEFCYTLGHDVKSLIDSNIDYNVVWYDTEIEPLCFLTECIFQRRLKPWGKRPVFPYFGHRDPMPMLVAYLQLFFNTINRVYKWIDQRLKRLRTIN